VTHSGPEVLFKTCVAMKFVDDDDDDDDDDGIQSETETNSVPTPRIAGGPRNRRSYESVAVIQTSFERKLTSSSAIA